VAQTPPNPIDSRLLARALEGNETAIAEIWRAWNPPLLRFLRSRHVTEPEDLAQQVWLEVARKLSDFEGDPDAFRRWIFTLAHRRLIDAARSERRRPRPAPLTERGERSTARFEDEIDGLDWALAVLAQLPDKQATAVGLRILGGMPVADVAAIMDEKESTVRVLTHRGLRRIERLLGPGRNSEEPVTPRSVSTLTPIT